MAPRYNSYMNQELSIYISLTLPAPNHKLYIYVTRATGWKLPNLTIKMIADGNNCKNIT